MDPQERTVLASRPLGPQASHPSQRFVLQEVFEPLDDKALVEELFIRLRQRIYQSLDRQQKPCYRERGRLTTGQSYFFLQPFNETGLLFECVHGGFRITGSSKIVGDETFIRNGESIEQAALMGADPSAFGEEIVFPRVNTILFDQTYMPFALYEAHLIQWVTEKVTHETRTLP